MCFRVSGVHNMGTMWSKTLQCLQNWYTLSLSKQRDEKDEAHQVFVSQVTKAVEEGDVEALKALHEEARTSMFGGLEYVQCTPPLLLLAVHHGHMSVGRYLLDLELDVDATDTCGMTALHEACKCSRNACLELLLSRSKHIDRRDVWGRTPLLKALVYRNTQAARVLLAKGANPNAEDHYGMTPLATAIDYNWPDMLSLLVYHGADLNLISRAQHQCSGPPLYRAINNQNLAMVQQLLSLGATTQPCNCSMSAPDGGLPTWPYLGHSTPRFSLAHALQHENAVLMAMSELVKRGDQHLSKVSLDILMQVLSAHGLPLGSSHEVMMRVLLASRDSSDPSASLQDHPQQVGLKSSSVLSSESVSSLLLKFYLCSGSCHEPDSLESLISPGTDIAAARRRAAAAGTTEHIGGQGQPRVDERGQDQNAGGEGSQQRPAQTMEDGQATGRRGKPVRKKKAPSLHTQSRRVARRALMSSGHNVTWATQRLHCPPALKTLLLLKDIDRAFSAKPPTIFYD
ncbi:ankyrin domain protein [Plakobranchus ocellatus]|uniref:Ankyrin domain protein n=1 Tax=Plakobranchus ocellatus TaxID=259542 RepID=A0AAV4CKT0_9GAST|nr:ankyrin domain protein [Plakobranchus ocellatus]